MDQGRRYWLVAVPLVAAGLTSCAATTYDQTLAPDTAAAIESTRRSLEEKPVEVNAALAKWLAAKLPDYWKS